MRKALYILGQLSDDDIDWMIDYGRRQPVSSGQMLIRQGEPIDALYLIVEGQFSVTDPSAAGRELARLGAGEIVGEMSLVDRSPPSATVTATQDSVVLAISRGALREKLKQDTGFAARFYYSLTLFLSDRLRATVKTLGYGTPKLDADDGVLQEDELDPSVLDSVHLAGNRFQHIIKRLQGS